MANVKAAIFDAGGVLHQSNSALEDDLAKELGLGQEDLRRIWEKQIPLLVSGRIDETEFWRQIEAEYGIRRVDVAENLLGRAFEKALAPHTEVLALVKDLRRRGVQLAVLSNTIEPHAKVLRESGQFEEFDKIFLSHEIGMRKPDPAIYKYVVNELKVLPQETAFIDDDKANVEAARALGANGILYDSPEQLAADLQNLIPPIRSSTT